MANVNDQLEKRIHLLARRIDCIHLSRNCLSHFIRFACILGAVPVANGRRSISLHRNEVPERDTKSRPSS